MNNVCSSAELLQNLSRDQPVLLPTDTVPALAIQPFAAERIWALKQRPAHKPLILMGADLAQLQQSLGVPWLPEWLQEAKRVWPGPVTLVIPVSGPLCSALNPGGESLGLRVPDCAETQFLLQRSGPLATTSVNRSGQMPALTAEEASLLFPDLSLLGPLPWPPGSGIPSEVRAWSEGHWQVLRPKTRSFS